MLNETKLLRLTATAWDQYQDQTLETQLWQQLKFWHLDLLGTKFWSFPIKVKTKIMALRPSPSDWFQDREKNPQDQDDFWRYINFVCMYVWNLPGLKTTAFLHINSKITYLKPLSLTIYWMSPSTSGSDHFIFTSHQRKTYIDNTSISHCKYG